MKKILITGANSFIGGSFEKYIKDNYSADFSVDTVDMVDGKWREMSFSGYDTVYHVAGIAHSDSEKISEEKSKLYYSVNTDLAVETAAKAKADGVGQFVFMSSLIVYGGSAPIGKKKMIGKETPLAPVNCYGNSKAKAEEGILALRDGTFKVCILRPPMIYGKGCRGNYPTLVKIATKLHFFPKVKNERSMIYIGNFVEFVRLMIKNGEDGIFFPQNPGYTTTCEMVKMIAAAHGRKCLLIPGFTWALKLLGLFSNAGNKAFGSLTYDSAMSRYREEYQKYDLAESIALTEN